MAGSSGQGTATAPPWLRQIIGDDEECLAAYRFKMDFEPAEGIDYKWVSQHSKELYALYSADLKDLDDKANSIITHLGSATGLIATASVFAVGMGTLHPLVAAFLAVPLLFALIALAYAVKTRKPTDTAASPMPKAASEYSEFFEGRGEAAFIGQWHLSIAIMRRVAAQKSRWVQLATRFLFLAIATSLVPLIVGVALKLRG